MSGGGKGGGDIDVNDLVKEQAKQNRVSQFTPAGSMRFGNINKAGQFVPQAGAASLQEDSPYQAAMRGGQEQASVQLANQLLPQAYNPLPGISTQGLPERPTDYGADRGRVERDVYDRAYSLIQPDFDMQQRRLDQQLANQGLPMGSEAYSGEQDRFQRGRGETLTRLAQGATEAGGAEQSRLQGMVEGGRQAGLGEQQLMRSGPLQELAMMLGGGQYNPTPAGQFYAPGQVNALDPGLAQASAKAQGRSDILGGLFGLGQAGAMGYAMGGPAGAGAGVGSQFMNSGYWGR